MSWFDDAACKGKDAALFFGSAQQTGQVLCRSCRVDADCLEYALARPSLLGVWGGATEPERERIRRARWRRQGLIMLDEQALT